ncbi:MAG: hypothetical protein H7X97_03465 [Opitutaceae bacterium]|nr:hypothetical protein [Verrucomicrobiales bacterium]
MPIRINLLAEAQAAEEMRRRDPVKRALWGASIVIVAVIAWSGSTQLKIIKARSALSAQESRWSSIEKDYLGVSDNLKKAGEVEQRLASLSRLSTNRFIWGNALNALQQTMVDQIVVTRIKTEQVYTLIDPVLPKPGAAGLNSGKPGAAVEKTVLLIEARDYGNPAEQNYNKFKAAIAVFPYFQSRLPGIREAVRLTSLSQPASDPAEPGRNFITFTLECQFPEVKRDE